MTRNTPQPTPLHGPLTLRHQIAEGLLYAHSRLNANQRKTLEAAPFRYALVELLSERSLITVDQLDSRKAENPQLRVLVNEDYRDGDAASCS